MPQPKWIISSTDHSDLAAYIVDDFGLMTEAWLLGVTDQPFIQYLTQSYQEGQLPQILDFKQLHRDIVAASYQAFAEIADELGGASYIGGFCIATDEGAMTVVPAFAPRSYLDGLEYSFDAFIWEEWPIERGADDAFNDICAQVGEYVMSGLSDDGFVAFRRILLQTMADALKEVRSNVAGVVDPFIWMLGVSDSELLQGDLPKLIHELNSADIAAKFDEHWKD